MVSLTSGVDVVIEAPEIVVKAAVPTGGSVVALPVTGPGATDQSTADYLADPDSQSVAAGSRSFVRFLDSVTGEPIPDSRVTVLVNTTTGQIDDIVVEEAP